jgi:hypothetical protein
VPRTAMMIAIALRMPSSLPRRGASRTNSLTLVTALQDRHTPDRRAPDDVRPGHHDEFGVVRALDADPRGGPEAGQPSSPSLPSSTLILTGPGRASTTVMVTPSTGGAWKRTPKPAPSASAGTARPPTVARTTVTSS